LRRYIKARVAAAAAAGSKKMSREECKRIEEKVSGKVMEGSTSAVVAAVVAPTKGSKEAGAYIRSQFSST
jgi:hypothetical protein